MQSQAQSSILKFQIWVSPLCSFLFQDFFLNILLFWFSQYLRLLSPRLLLCAYALLPKHLIHWGVIHETMWINVVSFILLPLFPGFDFFLFCPFFLLLSFAIITLCSYLFCQIFLVYTLGKFLTNHISTEQNIKADDTNISPSFPSLQRQIQ